MTVPGHNRRAVLPRLLLLLAVPLLLILGHLSAFWGGDVTGHFSYLAERLIQMSQGDWWVAPGPVMDSGVNLVSPLYAWLYAPVLLADNPIDGLWVFYLALELLSVGGFLFCCLRWRLLTPALAWTVALLLCVEPMTKTVKTENLTVAVHLATPMFALFLAGLGKAGRGAMAAAGVLLGMAAQIHISAIFTGPALAMAVWRSAARPVRALIALSVGFALVLPISLLSLTFGEASPAGAGGVDLALGSLLERLWREAPGPLTLAGALVVVVALARKQAPPWGVAGKLALGWSVSVFLLLTLALEVSGSDGPAAPRYLAMRPAGPVLGGIALVWIGGLAQRLLGERKLPELVGVYLLALGLLGHGAWRAHGSWADWQRQLKVMSESPGGVGCHFTRNPREGRSMKLMYSALRHAGVADLPGRITAVEGHERRITTALVAWARRGREPAGEGARLAVAPKPGGQGVRLIHGVTPAGMLLGGRLLVMYTVRGQRGKVSLSTMTESLNQCPTRIEDEPGLLVTATVRHTPGHILELLGLEGEVVNRQVFELR